MQTNKNHENRGLAPGAPGLICYQKVIEFLMEINGPGPNSNKDARLYKNVEFACLAWLAWLAKFVWSMIFCWFLNVWAPPLFRTHI